MIVLNLRCGGGHLFEGWFSSADDFNAQCDRKDVLCPTCNSSEVGRVPSAPKIMRSDTASRDGNEARQKTDQSSMTPELAEKLIHALAGLAATAEDVSTRFAEEARKIHYGEAEARQIKGIATREETQDLLDEGIPVLPLPDKGAVH
ncbi:MAG: DUF1178 family protein [Rhodocyclaceae bacterium]|nr:MAG: DUF1178 family protein [Rhodocyclaceae bacterium]